MAHRVEARPEPVLDAARLAGNVAGVVTGLAGIFAAVGAVTGWSWALATAAALGAVGAFLAKCMPLVTAFGARAQVTPLAQPQAMDGTPLTPSAAMAPVSADVSASMGPDVREIA